MDHMALCPDESSGERSSSATWHRGGCATGQRGRQQLVQAPNRHFTSCSFAIKRLLNFPEMTLSALVPFIALIVSLALPLLAQSADTTGVPEPLRNSLLKSQTRPANEVPVGWSAQLGRVDGLKDRSLAAYYNDKDSAFLSVFPQHESSSASTSELWNRRRKTLLGQSISRGQLAALDLSLYRQPGDLEGNHVPNLGCGGGVCPSLETCEDEGIQACHVPAFRDSGTPPAAPWAEDAAGTCPDEGDLTGTKFFLPHCKVASGDRLAAKWQAQVIVLKNVLIDANGDVFNGSHVFFPGGCVRDRTLHPKFSYGPKTELLELSEVINMAIGPRGRHGMYEYLERLPLFLTMAPLLRELVGRARFHFGLSKVLSRALNTLLGVSLKKYAIKALEPNQLIFAHTLYQPVHQPCNIASPSLWTYLRASHLLAPSPPIFNPDWTLSRKLPEQPLQSGGSGAELPPDWAVVLAQPPQAVPLGIETHLDAYYRQQITSEQMMRQEFWWDSLVTFGSGWQSSGSKSLFNRAAFFVTTPGHALTKMVHMPRGSVLLMVDRAREQKGSGVVAYHSGTIGHLRTLAAASGLVFATVLCPSTSDGSVGITCGRDIFAEALAWGADQVFQSGILPESKGWEAASRLLPGTGLKSPQEVDSFRSWAECVSQKGSWVMDPTPRPMAWPHAGIIEKCDRIHMALEPGNIAGVRADEIALNSESDPASWRVRDSAKYVWRVSPQSCPAPNGIPTSQNWVRFDKEEMCRRRGSHKLHVVLLGDSLQDQLGEAIAQNVLIGQPNYTESFHFDTLHECQDWLQAPLVRHPYCRLGVFSHQLCPGLHLEFLRNDHLEVFHHGKPRFDHIPWAQELKPHLDRADIIVINRGPHYTPMPQFVRGLKAASRLLRRLYPDKLLVFRNTPPGHLNCTDHLRPLTKRQDPSTLPYHWGDFQEQNQEAKRIVEELGFVYMDVDTMTGLRADGHKGLWTSNNIMDCLHYCSPGPIDGWVQLLFNMMKNLKLDMW